MKTRIGAFHVLLHVVQGGTTPTATAVKIADLPHHPVPITNAQSVAAAVIIPRALQVLLLLRKRRPPYHPLLLHREGDENKLHQSTILRPVEVQVVVVAVLVVVGPTTTAPSGDTQLLK